MITIREYANQNKVSYEAVRRRIARLGDTITPHIFIENGVKVIDDEGVELLKTGGQKVPVIVYTEEVQAELNEARDTIKDLQEQRLKDLEKINEINERFIAMSEELTKLKVEQAKLESTNKALLEDKERSKQDLQTITEAKVKSELELQQAQESNTKLQSELEDKAQEIQEQAEELASYHKTVFGLYRKDKKTKED